MRATVMYGAGDVRVETVPDAHLVEPTDAVVRVMRAAICGSDLWPYKSMPPNQIGRRMGHEFIGVVGAIGADVQTLRVGQLVVAPFLVSDGTCAFCREGMRPRVSTARDLATRAWMPDKVRQCACPTPTAPCSCCRSLRTTRSCRRCSR